MPLSVQDQSPALSSYLRPETCLAAPHAATLRGLVYQLIGLPARRDLQLDEELLIDQLSELGLFQRGTELTRGRELFFGEGEALRLTSVARSGDWQVIYSEAEKLTEPVVCFARYPEGVGVGVDSHSAGVSFNLILLVPADARPLGFRLICRLNRLKRRWEEQSNRALFEALGAEEICATFEQAEQQLSLPLEPR